MVLKGVKSVLCFQTYVEACYSSKKSIIVTKFEPQNAFSSIGDYPNSTLLNTIKCSVEILASFKTVQGIYIIYCEIKFFQDYLDIRLIVHGKQPSI